MKTDTDVTREIEQWLEDGTRPLPAHVLDGAMSTVARTNQLGAGHGWPLWLTRSVSIGGWAVAVVVVAVLAPMLLLRDGQPTSVDGGVGVGAGASPVPVDVLVGVWTTTDVDGSTMTLTIAPGSAGDLQISLLDDYARGCDGLGATDTVFHGTALGVHRGDELHVVWVSERCGDLVLNSPPFVLTYDPATDQLAGMEVTWTR